MQASFAEQLINRRTEDGSWLQGCDHTTMLLNPKIRNKIIFQCVNHLKDFKEFDSIACCGISGLLVVPQISEILKKNMVVIRKKNDKRYSPFQYEGAVPKKYIIVDDLICSGDTIRHILDTIKQDCPRSQCLGVYCFMKDKCAYRTDYSLCKKDLDIDYL
jgi:orotate phosphoribosyltransferase